MPKGPKGQKRPADVIGNAVKVMHILTGEKKEDFGADVEHVGRNRRQPYCANSRHRSIGAMRLRLLRPPTLEVAMLGITVPGLAETTQAGLDALETMGLSRLRNRFYVHLVGRRVPARAHRPRVGASGHAAARPGETRCLLLDEPPPTSMWHTMVRVARPLVSAGVTSLARVAQKIAMRREGATIPLIRSVVGKLGPQPRTCGVRSSS